MINDIKYFYIFEEEIEDFCEDISDIVAYYSLEDCNIEENDV